MYRFLQIIGYRLNLFEEYFLNNYRHRTDGPAVIHYDIDEYSFWVNSTIRDKEAKKVIKELKIPKDFRQWDEYQKMMFQLHFLAKVGL